MRIDSRTGVRGVLLNVDQNTPVRWPIWYEIENGRPEGPGQFEAWRGDPEDFKRMGFKNSQRSQLIYLGKCRLKFIPGRAITPLAAAPAQMPGERQRYAQIVPVEDRPCQHKTCDRDAEWLVADEMELPPEAGPDGKPYEQAVIRNIRYYCSRHYQPPRLFDGKGELIQVVDEIGARPS